MNEGLTEQEKIFYASYGLLDVCDCCNDYFPIYNYHEEINYLTLIGNKIYCQKCLVEN